MTHARTTVANAPATLIDVAPAAESIRDHHAIRLAEYADAAKGAYSNATERARRSDLACFVDWAISQRLDALPAQPATIRAYVQHLDGLGRAPATIERRLQSIAHMHKAAGVDPSPTSASVVRLAMRRITRQIAERGEQRGRGQAKPATLDVVAAMLQACDKAAASADTETAAGRRAHAAAVRDAAMIALAYASLMRRGEIVALNARDLEMGRTAAQIKVRRSKTDQIGQGATVGIDAAAAARVRAYLDGRRDGPLFQSVNGARLDAKEIARAIKRRAAEAGLDPAALSAHSTRVGAAVDGASAGRTMAQLQRDGRWKGAAMVARYTAAVDAERDAEERASAARKLYGLA